MAERLIEMSSRCSHFIFKLLYVNYAGLAVRLTVVVVVGSPLISGGANGGFSWLDRLFTAIAWQNFRKVLPSTFYLANPPSKLTFRFFF